MTVIFFALSAVAAAVLSCALTPATRRLALAVGAIDHPGPRKVHEHPTPRLGGLARRQGRLREVHVGQGSRLCRSALEIQTSPAFASICRCLRAVRLAFWRAPGICVRDLGTVVELELGIESCSVESARR